MLAVCFIALLCLVSVSHSAPLGCEDLLRPLDQVDFHHLEGRRALVASSLETLAPLVKLRESASIKFSNETSKISVTRILGFNDSCHYLHTNVTLEGSSFFVSQYNATVTFIHTSCPDCLLMHMEKASEKYLRLSLFSSRREVEEKEMEEFRAQVECLKLPLPVVMDPSKELCPEKDPAAQTEEATEGQKA